MGDRADKGRRLALPRVELSGPFVAPANFCSSGAMLHYLLLATLVALLVCLGTLDTPGEFWLSFGLVLPFVVWITLVSLALLCQIQRRLSLQRARNLSLAVIGVVGLVSSLSSLLLILVLPIEDSSSAWFVFRNTLVAVLLGFVLTRYLVLQGRWRVQIDAESRARLSALQARIHPHFLFNALNTVTELVHSRPEQAEQALLDLSDLLRSGLRNESEHSLAEELRLIRSYLRLEALRLGDRLQVDWQVDESIDQSQIRPALLIQPLVENAVLHGIAPNPEGGLLKVRFELVRFGRIRVVIENPLPTEPRASRSGNGTALENIRQRLALAFDEGAQLKAERVGDCFRAVLTLPAGRKPTS